jgi:hypothetical protein
MNSTGLMSRLYRRTTKVLTRNSSHKSSPSKIYCRAECREFPIVYSFSLAQIAHKNTFSSSVLVRSRKSMKAIFSHTIIARSHIESDKEHNDSTGNEDLLQSPCNTIKITLEQVSTVSALPVLAVHDTVMAFVIRRTIYLEETHNHVCVVTVCL